jgi:hypothetical protein
MTRAARYLIEMQRSRHVRRAPTLDEAFKRAYARAVAEAFDAEQQMRRIFARPLLDEYLQPEVFSGLRLDAMDGDETPHPGKAYLMRREF